MRSKSDATIVYEVSLEVDAGIEDSFREWLTPHIQEVVSLGKFVGADLLSEGDLSPTSNKVWIVQYHVRNRADLDAYFEQHAPRLRQEGHSKFGDCFRASRKILNIEKSF